MLTPKTIHDDLHEHHTQVVQLFSKHPWLIPATTLLHIIPVVVGINGFWKLRALSKQLKIEREKTKQLALQQVDKVQSAVTSHHCQHPSLRQLFKQIRSHH
ncbi:transposase [Lactiplantibacillus plantarum]